MTSSSTWPEFTDRYQRYRAMPVWGTMLRVPDHSGRLDQVHIDHIAARGKRACGRVAAATVRFQQRGGEYWPASPQALHDPEAWRTLRSHSRLGSDAVRNFFDALIFDRDSYTCRYCGREVFQFYEETGRRRTLWLVVDHLDADRKARGLFEVENSATTCWTCNTIKGPLPEKAFLEELDSLVQARTRLLAQRGA